MKEKTIIICGCTKNSERYIENHLEKLYSLYSYCKKLHMVIYENNSVDDTKEKLKDFSKNNENVHLLLETVEIKPQKGIYQKPYFLAYARNKLLSYIRKKIVQFDYIVMVDLDNVISNFEPFKFYQTMEKYKTIDWDVLTANSDYNYYDIWALRINENIWNSRIHEKLWKSPIDYDCWQMGNPEKYVFANKINIPTDFNCLIPVNSAFGGLAIYKSKAIKNCHYSAYSEGKITCEHVFFHHQILTLNQGKIFICPDLIVKSQSR